MSEREAAQGFADKYHADVFSKNAGYVGAVVEPVDFFEDVKMRCWFAEPGTFGNECGHEATLVVVRKTSTTRAGEMYIPE